MKAAAEEKKITFFRLGDSDTFPSLCRGTCHRRQGYVVFRARSIQYFVPTLSALGTSGIGTLVCPHPSPPSLFPNPTGKSTPPPRKFSRAQRSRSPREEGDTSSLFISKRRRIYQTQFAHLRSLPDQTSRQTEINPNVCEYYYTAYYTCNGGQIPWTMHPSGHAGYIRRRHTLEPPSRPPTSPLRKSQDL